MQRKLPPSNLENPAQDVGNPLFESGKDPLIVLRRGRFLSSPLSRFGIL